MNDREKSNYKEYLFKLTEKELFQETKTVVLQDYLPDQCMMIQCCYNEWRNRGKGERFLEAYNKTLEPIEKDFH